VNSESISVILPVYNHQSEIVDRVEQMLDDLSVLTDQVELLVIDDGSKDATPEVLDELRRRYPQVSVIRHPCQLGPGAAVQTGMQSAKGEYVFAQESYDELFLEDLKKLWQLRGDRSVLMARARTRTRRIDQTLLQKLAQWGKQVEDAWLGKPTEVNELQMYCREAIQKLGTRIHEGGEVEVAHFSHRRVATPYLNSRAAEMQTVRVKGSRWTE
jgi:glycosyltransferase involved in cell wall biosynthesis